jgi:two-component system heavy metal sensor histidine kinase CusS
VKSIATRLAVWYALAATITLACLSVIGFFALEKNLIHGLDLLNAAQFNQIKAHLGRDYRTLSPPAIDDRIRETTDYASVLFYIDIHNRKSDTLFNSSNLRGQTIPDLPGRRVFSTTVPGIGELRAGEFLLEPYDVMVATPVKPVRDLMIGYVQISVALVSIMLIVSVAIGFGLSHFALRPVFIIEETANRIRSDNLSERIPLGNIDAELANLGRLLNQMFDRLESSFEQIRRFTGDASHELKTPLSLLRLQAERMLMEGGLSPSQEEAVHVQLEEVTRLNQIIEELLLISRAEARSIGLERTPQQPALFLQGFAQDARVLAEHRGLQFREMHGGDGSVEFDPKWIRQVLLNLLTNALNVSPPGGTVTIRSTLFNQTWRVEVEDEGLGVPAHSHARIFERFVRLAPADGSAGSGLGLAICRGIVELHKGRIWAESGRDDTGLRVVFELPTLNVAELPAVTENPAPQRFRWDPRVIWANLRRHQQWYTD